MSRVARSAVRLGTRLWLLQFAALPAAAVEARGCEKQLDCGSCVAHGCTFCDSKDVRSCFEPGSASAHSGICREPLKLTAAQCNASEDPKRASECPSGQPSGPCVTGGACTKGCCTIGAEDWLVRYHSARARPETFSRVDVIVKALLAEQWRITGGEAALGGLGGSGGTDNATAGYVRFQAHKFKSHHSRGQSVSRLVQARLDMYRATFASVREHGLLWQQHPIEVNRRWQLLDGAHRVAIALATRQHDITLRQTCSGRSPGPMSLGYLQAAAPAMLPEVTAPTSAPTGSAARA